MGKWACDKDNCPGVDIVLNKILKSVCVKLAESRYPDYCPGSVYIMSPRTGLELARTSTQVPIGGYLAAPYVTGILVEKTMGKKLRSLSPLFGQRVWDEYLSLCPFLTFIRQAFNPIVESTGSADSQMTYAKSPTFIFCVFVDILNYKVLFPYGLNFHILDNFCSRE